MLSKAEVKYLKSAKSDLEAHASIDEESLQRFMVQSKRKRKGLITVDTKLIDKNGVQTSTGVFQWFIQSR